MFRKFVKCLCIMELKIGCAVKKKKIIYLYINLKNDLRKKKYFKNVISYSTIFLYYLGVTCY